MPCLRDYIEQDPYGAIVKRGTEVVSPEAVVKEARQDLRELPLPGYRNDPSYFWARPSRRRLR